MHLNSVFCSIMLQTPALRKYHACFICNSSIIKPASECFFLIKENGAFLEKQPSQNERFIHVQKKKAPDSGSCCIGRELLILELLELDTLLLAEVDSIDEVLPYMDCELLDSFVNGGSPND